MLYALLSGLAGVEDLGQGFECARLSPRWPAAEVMDAEVQTVYASSGAALHYDYRQSPDAVEMTVTAPATEVQFHVLLPEGRESNSVMVNGDEEDFQSVQVETSRYVDFAVRTAGETQVMIRLKNR